jgi:hypothetical protein
VTDRFPKEGGILCLYIRLHRRERGAISPLGERFSRHEKAVQFSANVEGDDRLEQPEGTAIGIDLPRLETGFFCGEIGGDARF